MAVPTASLTPCIHPVHPSHGAPQPLQGRASPKVTTKGAVSPQPRPARSSLCVPGSALITSRPWRDAASAAPPDNHHARLTPAPGGTRGGHGGDTRLGSTRTPHAPL